jgi:hypothetical protein
MHIHSAEELLVFHEMDLEKCFDGIHLYILPQPTRLNVFKNDQDTWDYTNPNLSGQGNAYSHLWSLLTLPAPLLPLWGREGGLGGRPSRVMPLSTGSALLTSSISNSFKWSLGWVGIFLTSCNIGLAN